MKQNKRWPACAALMACLLASPWAAHSQSAYYDPVRDVMVPIIQKPRSAYAEAEAAPPAPLHQNQFRLLIRNGWLTTGPTQLTVAHGTPVTITAESNISDRLEIEGYGIAAVLPANQPVVLRFTAEAPGRFEYRLASTDRVIGVLEVGPPGAEPAAAPVAPPSPSPLQSSPGAAPVNDYAPTRYPAPSQSTHRGGERLRPVPID